ncbi:unnamed protein product [Cladocopium goreaui]|uniref:Uncharacterized protein n=1 Tax=Cladocopium goreaui TaxID=2562237 RepID=A0A9P1GS47_9DINO|nr:unnamed protein product [Cladocopium goreaui]
MVQHQSEVFSHAEFKDVRSEAKLRPGLNHGLHAIMRLAGESVELWSGQRLIMISRNDEHRPLARFGATVAMAPDCSAVLVMGGIEGHIIGGVCLNEVWRFDVDEKIWNLLETPPWSPRRGAIPVVCEGRLLLVGGTGLDAHPVREVWAADMQRWYPVNWQSTSTNAPWEDAICALWVCNSQNNHYGGSLLLFDATSTLWSSKDDGCTWSKLAKLPFGQGSEQLAFVCHCCGVLVAVTISTRVWMSQDGVTWSAADVARGDPMGPYSNGNSLPMSDRPPGLRCQVTDVVSLDSSEMLVVARHRETCKLTLWRLALQEGRACWQCLVPDIHIYPGFSSVNQLVAAGRAAVKTPEGEEMRAVYVEFNPINEFTVWRASPLAVDRHRQMLDRLGTGQTKVDIFTWQKHIMGALLPQMGNDWVPRGLSIQAIQTSELPYQEEDEFTYWH